MIRESMYAHGLGQLLAPVAPLLEDASVSEVMINGPSQVFVERGGCIQPSAARFDSEAALTGALRLLAQYTGRPLGPEHPILEARLPDGSRVEAVLPPVAPTGPCVSIRRFSRDRLTVDTLLRCGSLTPGAVTLLEGLVQARQNILVAGGTGTGKTSLLNVLSGFIPEGERVLVLEDSRELQLRGAHVVPLEARPADHRGRGAIRIRDLFKASLRMRPDRLVVGEIRDGAALDLIQAMTSGHGGCLTTLHASHPRDALARLETMALMADVEMPLRVLRAQIASGVDVVVQLVRMRSGQRWVSHVSQVHTLSESGEYRLEHLMVRQTAPGGASRLVPTGASPACTEVMRCLGADGSAAEGEV